jgi:UDP-N-acetylmuramate--alanine ligase
VEKKPRTGKHIHLIGIGGTGLSAIARVLLGRGFKVTGSDEQLTQRTADLYAAGAVVYKGHRPANIQGAQMVVVSSAIPDTNPEVQAARQAGIPVLKRDEFLGSLMTKQVGVAIAGTHGKTTTAGMVAHIFIQAGWDPSFVVGDDLPSVGTNGRAGQGTHFIIEADEYDRMFLGLRPKIGVITNIEYDHPDIYESPEAYDQAFETFAKNLPAGGRLVVCAEDDTAVTLLKANPQVQTYAYGIGFPITPMPGLELILAPDPRPNSHGGMSFTVEQNLQPIGNIELRVPGEHNVNNALAAICVALGEGIPFETISAALATFPGMKRRFDILGQVGNITVVDDYAHHPTEIAATLAAARQRYPQSRLIAAWQPHTFSRLKALMPEFTTCFATANEVVVLDVFRSREKGDAGQTAQNIAKQIKHPKVLYVGDLAAAQSYLLNQLRAGDVLLLLNAGDARVVGEWIVDSLREKLGEQVVDEDETVLPSDEKRVGLDATLSQVQRLVARLQQNETDG